MGFFTSTSSDVSGSASLLRPRSGIGKSLQENKKSWQLWDIATKADNLLEISAVWYTCQECVQHVVTNFEKVRYQKNVSIESSLTTSHTDTRMLYL